MYRGRAAVMMVRCRYPLDAHVEANAVEEERCLAKVQQLLAGDPHIAG